MKKTIAVTFLALGTLFMFSNAAFANICTYKMHVKNFTGVDVTITGVSYIYADDPFAVWWGFATQEPKLNNSTDVYTESVTNITLTCDRQKFVFAVEYLCVGTDGVTRGYDKETEKFNGGLTNNVYIIITGCNDDLFYKEDSWPETSFAGYVAGYIYGTNSNAEVVPLRWTAWQRS